MCRFAPALLGVCLVLKHYSMIGDGLSHVSFGALSVAVALGVSPLWISIPIVIVASFCLLRIRENAHMKNDAAIAVVSSSALAIGITVTALTTGINTDVSSYMFGSILVMNEQDVMISIVLCVIVLALFILFYSRIFSITFDENFSKASGIPVGRFNALLSGSYSSDDHPWHANDGSNADFKPYYFSSTYSNASSKKL